MNPYVFPPTKVKLLDRICSLSLISQQVYKEIEIKVLHQKIDLVFYLSHERGFKVNRYNSDRVSVRPNKSVSLYESGYWNRPYS